MKLVTQFMMVGTRIVHKLRLYTRFQFDGYRDGEIGANQKVHEHPSTNKALTKEQKSAIRKYIDRLDKINIWTRPQMIIGAANYLTRFEDRIVGHQWLKQFFERNLEYHVRKQKALAADRKHGHSVHDMSDYFEKVKYVMSKKRITDLDVWNMDETGFQIGCGKAQLVVTIDFTKTLRMIDPKNRDYITSVECIGSAGRLFLLCFSS